MKRKSATHRLDDIYEAIKMGQPVPPLREQFSPGEIKLLNLMVEHGRAALERRVSEIMEKAECSFSDVCHALGVPVKFATDIMPTASQKK